MVFANTTYLWGFLALLVPIAIHFLNRGDVKIVKVGSIQFLREQETTQARNVKLNELFLLVLRMLLISIIVLILAGPKQSDSKRNKRVTYLVEPSLLNHPQLKSFVSDKPDEIIVRALSAEFPILDREEAGETLPMETPNYWQLIQETDALKIDSIVVFSRGLLSGVKGMRPEVSNNIKWIVISDEEPAKDTFIAAFKNGSDLQLIQQKSDLERTTFKTLSMNSQDERIQILYKDSLQFETENQSVMVPIIAKDTIDVSIVFNDEFENESQYFQAALNGIAVYTSWPIKVKSIKDKSSIDDKALDVLVWLHNDVMPEKNIITINYKEDKLSNQLLEKGVANNNFHLTKRLNIEAVANGEFASQLAELLDLQAKLEPIIAANDKRIVSQEELQTSKKTEKVEATTAILKDRASWFWLLLLPIVILERILSKYRKQ